MIPGKRQPRIFYGWWMVAASSMSNAVLAAAYYQGFSAFFLPIESHFGWNRTAISGAMSLRQAETGLLGPIVGLLINKVGPRKLILMGGVTVSIGLIGLGLINGLLTFYLCFTIISIGASGMGHGVTWPMLMARWFRRHLGLAIGLASIGPIFAAPLVIVNTNLVDAFSWRAVLVGYGVVCLVVVSTMSLIVRDRPEPYGYLPDGDRPDPNIPSSLAGQAQSHNDEGLSFRQIMRTKAFWLLMTFFAGMFIGNSAFQAHQIPYFVNDMGLSAGSAAISVTIVVLVSGIGRVGAGFLVDRFEYRIVLIVTAALMAGAFFYLVLVDSTTLILTLPYDVMFGLSFGSAIPLRGALASAIFGNRSLGPILGLIQGVTIGAGVVGPILMGVIFDLRGDYELAVWILGGIALTTILPILFMGPKVRLEAS